MPRRAVQKTGTRRSGHRDESRHALMAAPSEYAILRILKDWTPCYVVRRMNRRRLAKNGPASLIVNHTRPADFSALREAMGLTPRECEVLGWVAHGKRDAEIGRILGISPRTVGKHIENFLAKLHAENRTGAVSAAHQHLKGS